MDSSYGPHDGSMNYKQSPYEYSNPVMAQPQPAQTAVQASSRHVDVEPRNWNSGLCGCCEDIGSCLCVWLFGPCYLCCCMSERMGEHCCAPVCLSMAQPGMFLPVLLYRTKLRSKYNIKGSAINDCCCAFCCGALVACQIKRELDHIESELGAPPFTRHD